MSLRNLALTLIALTLGALSIQAHAQARQPANEQVIDPELDRRDVRAPRFPSNDFEAGLFVGTYATQNFGSNVVAGVRAGYHLTEDVFVQAVYAQTKVSDEAFRRVLPGGVFPNERETLSYYNLSAGFNILPGEVFIGSKRAKASAVYVIGGIGSTKIVDQRRQTINVGLGMRVLLADWLSVQVDLRDHIFSLDLLGKRENTQNLELTGGLSFYF